MLESGWRMEDIDRMDMIGFFRLRAWKAGREQKQKSPAPRFIDEVWGSLRPNV